MIRRPPRSTQSRSSAASDVYKRQPSSFLPDRYVVCVRYGPKNGREGSEGPLSPVFWPISHATQSSVGLSASFASTGYAIRGEPQNPGLEGARGQKGQKCESGGLRPPLSHFCPFCPLAPSRPGFWGSRVRLPGQGRPRFLPPFSRSISGRKKRKKSHLHPKLLNQALLRGAGAPWAPVAGGPPRGLGGYPLTLLGMGQGSSHDPLANRGFGASNGRPEAPICQ